MNTRMQINFAMVVALLAVQPHVCLAVNTNRAAAQSKNAPGWAGSKASNDLSRLSAGSTINSPDRDRVQSRVAAPAWNNNTQPNISATQPYQPYQPSYIPPAPPQGEQGPQLDRWRLGVYPDDTDTGVRISQIVSGSAAERAGLEVNDRIVSVHGYQIGYVDGVLFDIGKELERHADDDGWIRMLVQNNRDSKLINLPVKLEPRQKKIAGTITYREFSALPRDAVATVELREILRDGLQPITIARQTITKAPRVPIPFVLEYDPTEVASGRKYVLNATISAGGRQLYAMRRDVPVLDGRSTGDLQLVVESATVYADGGLVQTRNEQLAQIKRWFKEYLGREPRAQELYVWKAHLETGGSLTDAQLQILSTPEFYYRANSNDRQYIYRMFNLVAQRQPSQQEVSQWLNRLQTHHRMRSDLAREFLTRANTQAKRR